MPKVLPFWDSFEALATCAKLVSQHTQCRECANSLTIYLNLLIRDKDFTLGELDSIPCESCSVVIREQINKEWDHLKSIAKKAIKKRRLSAYHVQPSNQ